MVEAEDLADAVCLPCAEDEAAALERRSSPGHVQVLVGLARVLKQDLLWPRAGRP